MDIFKLENLQFLLGQLSNSMEFYSKQEFVDHIGKQTHYSSTQLENIFDEYWKLDPIDRMNFGFDIQKCEEFVNQFI